MQAVRAVGRMSQPELAAEAIFLVADANSGNLEVLGAATRALMWMSGPAAGREVARFLIEHPDRSDTAILLLRRLHFLRGDVRDALVLAAQQSSAVASRVGTMLLKLDDEAAFGTPPSTSRVDLEALARWQREQPWHARFEAAEAGARANGRGIWKSWASEAGDTTRAIENRPLLLPAEPESWPPIASEVPAQPTLNAALNQLGDGRASFRWEALRLVGQLPRPDLAVETILLIADANRNNPDVFASARHALMWMSGGRAAREIVRFLFERPSRAETAVSLLCRLHYVRLDVVVALEALARSSSDEVVARARAFIERLGDRE